MKIEDINEKKSKITVLLPEIADLCRKDHVALIDEESVAFIGNCLRQISCKRLLEIGSGYGYSALCFLQQMLTDGIEQSAETGNLEIVTIERMQSRWEMVNHFIDKAGVNHCVHSILGEAPDAFAYVDFSRGWDCVFVDAAMGRYTDFWFQLKDMVNPGGLFIADNINLHGVLDVVPAALPRRHRTMQKRLKEFLQVVEKDRDWCFSRYPWGDGLLIAQKR